jgi:hypothetical protein
VLAVAAMVASSGSVLGFGFFSRSLHVSDA